MKDTEITVSKNPGNTHLIPEELCYFVRTPLPYHIHSYVPCLAQGQYVLLRKIVPGDSEFLDFIILNIYGELG